MAVLGWAIKEQDDLPVTRSTESCDHDFVGLPLARCNRPRSTGTVDA